MTGAIQRPADLDGADFYLSDRTRDDVSAAVALDLLLGTQAGRPTGSAASEPPLVFDNLNQIRSRYEQDLAKYRVGQTNVLNTVTIAGFFAGLGLALLVAMLGLMRIVSGVHLWIPVVGVTTSCLFLGAIVLDLSRLATGQETVVAFSSYHAPIPKAGKADSPVRPQRDATAAANGQADRLPVRAYAHQHVAGKPGGQRDLVKTLFWNPLLVAGPDGKASIHFELSDVQTTFRLMINAHGDGRLAPARRKSLFTPVRDCRGIHCLAGGLARRVTPPTMPFSRQTRPACAILDPHPNPTG